MKIHLLKRTDTGQYWSWWYSQEIGDAWVDISLATPLVTQKDIDRAYGWIRDVPIGVIVLEQYTLTARFGNNV